MHYLFHLQVSRNCSSNANQRLHILPSSPEGLASCWIFQVPVIFVLLKQDRGQPRCKILYFVLAQLALPLHQLGDEENHGSNFIFHLQSQPRSCWSREGTAEQRDLIKSKHYQAPRVDAAKPAQARMDRARVPNSRLNSVWDIKSSLMHC